jgi:hypothetical protein
VRNSREDELVYRRGLIMGLTMAEVMVLMLFALLLLIGLQARRLSESSHAKDQLVQVAKAMGIEPREIPENFDRLVSAAELAKEMAKEAKTDPASANGLRETKELIEVGRGLREQLGKNTVGQTPSQAAKEFVVAAGAAFNKQGKRFGSAKIWVSDAITAQQNDEGNGRVLPPCATGLEGKPAYIFTMRLFNESLEVLNRDLEAVRSLDAWPLFEQVTRQERLDPATFLRQTRDIFEWSKSKNCRFFVWIDDGTGVAEKRLYKQRLRAVGQHFYYFEPNESVEGANAAQ